MKYETAKALKDAGFPQHGEGRWWLEGYTPAQVVLGILENKKVLAYQPALHELIEACGLPVDLWVSKNGSRAKKGDFEEIGKTPEEAVANLWLELNEAKE